MKRRSWLARASAAALSTLMAEAALAQHEHHHPPAAGAAPPVRGQAALQAAASQCVAVGQVCLAHCVKLLGEGDKSMADCARTVSQMLPLCQALVSLAGQASALTPALARVALDACNRCADACKVHAGHHAECKACYEACLECIKQCKAAG